MTAEQRFPKPDVPWLHDIEPDVSWPYGVGRIVSFDGRWEAVVEDQVHADPCAARSLTAHGSSTAGLYFPASGGWFCALPCGHESPHIASRDRDCAVTSLRRMARPAEVAS